MGISYFIVKAIQFWDDIRIFSDKGYLKETDMTESAVEFLVGGECDPAGCNSF